MNPHLMVIITTALLLAGCSSSQKAADSDFMEAFRKSFTQSCVAGSTSGPKALSAKRALTSVPAWQTIW